MCHGSCFFLLMVVIFDIAVCTNEIKLTPSQIDVSENSSAILTCSKVNGILAETRWQNSQITESANLAFYNGQCIVTRFLLDSDLFEGVCHGNGTYSVVLKRISRTQHGVAWICKETDSAISNKVAIHVSVPAVIVTLKRNEYWDHIKENQTKIITCTTSLCRPDPMVQWYLRNRTGQVVTNLTQFSTNHYVNGEYGLKSVKSVLDLRLNRTANNLLLFCEVWTRSSKADITSREIIINVTFPPESKPVILGFENINIMRVIESETENSVCSISGGNPVASFSWNCFGSNDVTTATQGSTVTSTVKWTASRNYSTCSCTSHHILTDWKRTTNVTVNVQYPPSGPHFKIGQTHVFGDTHVIQNNTLRVACNSKSNPLSNYTWTGPGFSGKGDTIEISSVKISNQGDYKCVASNRMIRTNGSYEDRSQSSSLSLTILYPAIVNDIYDVSIVEGTPLEILCPVKYGNPSNSTVTWSRLSDGYQWNNIQLSFKNVSRADDANYTCSVTTEMYPTIGSSSKIETRKSFHLNVFFPSEIYKFSISPESSDRTIVVNKTQNLSVECIAEANPSSDLKIKSPRGDYIIEVSRSNIARHTLRNASFKDAGEYICTGRNNYTRDSPSQSKLVLIVKSRPRPSSGDTSVKKVATVLNVDVTLPFQARNYLDEPNKTMFSWFKENVSISDNDNKYMIHSYDLQTNITIRNTTHQDLGLYKVNVENSVGMYTHFYDLKATDKPEPPRDFRLMNDTVTDTSVALSWRPGFNGGFQQTFVIIYKMIHERVWLNKSIKDNGDINMNYTLNDLSSLHDYETEMFAKNIEGNSIHTERFHFKTKGIKKSKETETMGSSNTGAFVGTGVGASVVTLALVAVSFFGYKRLKNIRSLRHECPKPGVTAGSHDLSTYTDLDASKREINNYAEFNVQYEHLNASTREPNTYMELQNTNVLNTDTSDYVNIRI